MTFDPRCAAIERIMATRISNLGHDELDKAVGYACLVGDRHAMNADMKSVGEAKSSSVAVVPKIMTLRRKEKKYPRHAMVEGGISVDKLESMFPAIEANFDPAQLDYTETIGYSRYKNWNISCYLRVWDGWTPRVPACMPLVNVMDPILDECIVKFAEWYKSLHGLAEVEVTIMNSFVTRYRPVNDQDQLKKHVDGRKVDGSVVLALPTRTPFQGGQLSVWDGKPVTEYAYQMKAGDILYLDNMVWHQAFPITTGERWALVIFCKCRWKAVKPC